MFMKRCDVKRHHVLKRHDDTCHKDAYIMLEESSK